MEVFADEDVMAHYLEDALLPGEPPYIYEAEIAAAIDRLLAPGTNWLNVGANLGYFARHMALVAGPEATGIMVEPDPDTMALLRRNMDSAPGTHHFLQGLADRERGEAKLYRQPGNCGDARGWPCAASEVLDVTRFRLGQAPVVRKAKPQFMVCDAQGMDHDVLAGLDAYRPPVAIIELWPQGLSLRGQNIVSVVQEIVEMGYRAQVLNNDLGLYTVLLDSPA